MPLVRRFTDDNGDDMLVVRDLDPGLWHLVARSRDRGTRAVREYVQIDFTEDQLIEFAETILDVVTQPKAE